MCVCMISVLPETEIALTPLLTASNFFSLLDTLEKKRKNNKLDNNYHYKNSQSRLTLRYNKTSIPTLNINIHISDL